MTEKKRDASGITTRIPREFRDGVYLQVPARTVPTTVTLLNSLPPMFVLAFSNFY